MSCGASLSTSKGINEEKVQETLGQNEQRDSRLFDSMTEMFAKLGIIYLAMDIIYDKSGKPVDGVFCEVNPVAEQVLDKSKEQLIGKSRKELFGHALSDGLLEKFDDVIKTEKPFHFERYGAALQKWYDAYAWKIAENQVGIISTETTERKKTEKDLEEDEERLEVAQGVAHVGSWEYFVKTDEAVWSKELFRIFGLNPEEKAPNIAEYRKLVYPNDLEELDSRMQRFFSEGKIGEVVSFDFRVLHSDGLVRYLHSERMIREVDENGKALRIVGVEQDITERMRWE